VAVVFAGCFCEAAVTEQGECLRTALCAACAEEFSRSFGVVK
jgi:hypothetical protein